MDIVWHGSGPVMDTNASDSEGWQSIPLAHVQMLIMSAKKKKKNVHHSFLLQDVLDPEDCSPAEAAPAKIS